MNRALDVAGAAPGLAVATSSGRRGTTAARMTWATVAALENYLRQGVPATWEAAEGTR